MVLFEYTYSAILAWLRLRNEHVDDDNDHNLSIYIHCVLLPHIIFIVEKHLGPSHQWWDRFAGRKLCPIEVNRKHPIIFNGSMISSTDYSQNSELLKNDFFTNKYWPFPWGYNWMLRVHNVPQICILYLVQTPFFWSSSFEKDPSRYHYWEVELIHLPASSTFTKSEHLPIFRIILCSDGHIRWEM